jgi:hypothetical protein
VIKFILSLVLMSVACLQAAYGNETSVAVAMQQSSPAPLPRSFKFSAISETNGIGINAIGSLTVETTLPDGTISGRVTLEGLRCGAINAEYTGRYDGSTITIHMPFEPAVLCKDAPPYVFQRKDGDQFEGRRNGVNSRGANFVLKIMLRPI